MMMEHWQPVADLIDTALPVDIGGTWSPRQAHAVLIEVEIEAIQQGLILFQVDVTTMGCVGPRVILLPACADCGRAVGAGVSRCECGRWQRGQDLMRQRAMASREALL